MIASASTCPIILSTGTNSTNTSLSQNVLKADRKLLYSHSVSDFICNDREKLCSLDLTHIVRAYVAADDADELILNCFGGVVCILWSMFEMLVENIINFCSKMNQLN